MQVVTFVDATSGADTPAGANSNRYYVNAFTATIVGTTGSFRTNTNRQVSRAVESNIEYIAGGTNIAAGVNDLTAQFEALPGTVAGVAVVVTDGRSSRAEATAAADRLRAAGVVVAAVAIGGEVDRATLDGVASTGSDGEELVFETDQFEDIAGLLAAVFTRIGAACIVSLLTGLCGCRNGALAAPRTEHNMVIVTRWCHADRDGDGVDDCRDRCPNDPNKTAPGRCGCGERDVTPCPDE